MSQFVFKMQVISSVFKNIFCALLSILFIPSISSAQAPLAYRYFDVKVLGPDQGLSQGSNYFGYEDSLGFMWISANDALNLWDGLNVRIFNLDKYFKNCPRLRQGYEFVEDNMNDIYVGSTMGLYHYHRSQNVFTLISVFDSTSTLTVPFAFKNGKIWCYNNRYQIGVYDTRNRLTRVLGGPKMEPMANTHAYSLAMGSFFYKKTFFDDSDNIWMANNKTLVCFNYKTKEEKHFLNEFIEKSTASDGLDKFKHNKIECFIYRKTDKTILLGTSNGFVHFDTRSHNYNCYCQLGNDTLKWVREVCVYKNDFLCVSKAGAFLFNTISKKAVFLNKEVSKSTFDFYPINIGVDKGNRIWMCKIGEGFKIVDFNSQPFHKEIFRDNELGFLPKGRIMGIAEMPNKNVLISVGKTIVEQNFSTRNISTEPKADFKDNYNDILVSDTIHNVMWKCGFDKLRYFNHKTEQFKTVPIEKRGDYPHQVQYHILPITKGEVLLAAVGGLYRSSGNIDSFISIKSLPDKVAFYINPIRNNRFLVSYLNDEMLLIQKKNDNTFEKIKTILPGVLAFYVYEEKEKNRFWIATNMGLILADAQFQVIEQFDESNGLAGSYLYGILSDDIGNIWVSHGHGISSINKESFKITNYSKDDGIQDWDYNNRSFFKASDGTLYFGGVNGFNYFKPPLLKQRNYQSYVYVDEIFYRQKPYLTDTNCNLIRHIKVESGIQNIIIKAKVCDLENAANQQLIYKLKGSKSQWNYANNPATISFYNLAPGTYVLELGIYDKYDKLVRAQKEIIIEVIPFFYQTTWFWLLVGVMIAFCIFFLYNKRKQAVYNRKLEKQKAILDEREKIIADLHDDVGGGLSSIRIISELLSYPQNNPQNVIQYAQKILGTVKDVSQKMSTFYWVLNADNDKLQDFCDYVKKYAIDFFADTPIELQYTAQVETAQELLLNSNQRKNLFLCVKEILNNALKHAQATKIVVAIEAQNTTSILIKIQDNGIGINKENQFGNGLKNLQKRATEINADLKFTSDSSGTSYTISLSLAS